jgi:acyl-CoA reductase-like NAD-dependent aldehyde dehydrogenase
MDSNDIGLVIDGRRVDAPATFDVTNPATGEVLAGAPDCSREQLDEAMAAAERAQREWRDDEPARRKALEDAANVLFANHEEIAPLLVAEQGKPLQSAKEEILGAGVWFKYYAGLELEPEVIQDDDKAYAEVVRRPMGVVAAITPWNFPVILASWKVAPALRAGNTVVLKPSPFTPLSTLKVAELLSEVLPPGVFNAVSGGDELGAWMTSHPTPRKVSFTGSVATGKKVAAAAAPDLKRVTLELGGNDPAIVLPDADVEEVAAKLFWGAFANSGQVCSAIKRVYAPAGVSDDLAEALAEQARTVRVGDGMDPESKLGPVNNRPQLDRVRELVDDAVATGGRVVAGGDTDGRPGYFFSPTIIAGLSDGARLVDEEQFGPALPVISYDDIEDAVARANGTHFGLSASVWSSDPERARAIADRLECGTVWINSHLVLQPHQPFGGFKWSGVGVENGPWGLAGFTETQVQYQAR